MFRRLDHRGGHYALLVGVAATLFVCRLGAPSLWDIDEGNNAEAAREMLDSGDWIVPTFNYQLRTDKPALLYWLQICAYRLFGVGEFGARLPSALAGIGTVLLTYELGRRMFGAAAGLLAGVMLAGTVLFCASSHFANPDALLNALTVLTFLIFWRALGRGQGEGNWFIPAGISAGFAVLAKGPVGLVLPLAVAGLFLLWSRRWQLVLDRRLFWGALAFAMVALPWYAWVGAETKADFLRGFILNHNVGRYLAPMENHGGPLYYYVVALAIGFAPWSPFLGLAGWHALRQLRQKGAGNIDGGCKDPAPATRFLACWIGVYFVFFSLAGTKLPNYILPLYPATALMTASVLDRWRRGQLAIPGWLWNLCLIGLVVVGVAAGVGLLVAGGAWEAGFMRGRNAPGLEAWAALGFLPVLAAAAAWLFARTQHRNAVVLSLAAASVLFVCGLVPEGGVVLDAQKAPRPLAKALQTAQAEREIRIACYQYFQPSLVFYCGREVRRLADEGQALEFMRHPLPVYLFLPAPVWDRLEPKIRGQHRLVANHRDLYRGCDVVLVTNSLPSGEKVGKQALRLQGNSP